MTRPSGCFSALDHEPMYWGGNLTMYHLHQFRAIVP
jgi:hypothetical protein